MVANSDVEVEMATSNHANATVCTDEAVKFVSKAETSLVQATVKSGDATVMSCIDGSYGMTVGKDKVDEPICGNADIVYSQDLVVQYVDIPSRVNTTANSGVLNFKHFRKVMAVIFLFLPLIEQSLLACWRKRPICPVLFTFCHVAI